MASSPIDPPISHAVLVPSSGVLEPDWEVLYANGDLAKARAVAEEWALANPGKSPVVMTYLDHCTAGMATNWARP